MTGPLGIALGTDTRIAEWILGFAWLAIAGITLAAMVLGFKRGLRPEDPIKADATAEYADRIHRLEEDMAQPTGGRDAS